MEAIHLFHTTTNSTYEMSSKSARWLIMKVSSMKYSDIFFFVRILVTKKNFKLCYVRITC